MTSRFVHNGFRLYTVAIGLLGGWTILTLTTDVRLASTTLGTMWLVLAALGAILTLGLYLTRTTTITATGDERRAFETNPLTGTPLSVYSTVLLGWSAVSAGWWLSGLAGLDPVLIAAGWFVIAGLGFLLTCGLCLSHWWPGRFPVGSAAGEHR